MSETTERTNTEDAYLWLLATQKRRSGLDRNIQRRQKDTYTYKY